jgi:hypothetical protein
MAHADYACCAICDSKIYYGGSGNAKDEICPDCRANLIRLKLNINNVDEFITWIKFTAPDVVLNNLKKLGYTACCYSNEVDDLIKKLANL